MKLLARLVVTLFAAVLIGIVGAMTVVALTRNAAAQPRIECNEHLCMVPRDELRRLIEEAELAEHYAVMCNWPGATEK